MLWQRTSSRDRGYFSVDVNLPKCSSDQIICQFLKVFWSNKKTPSFQATTPCMALRCNCQGASISISHPFLKLSISIHLPWLTKYHDFSSLKICHIFHVADRIAQFYINFTLLTDYHNFLKLNVTYLTTFSIKFTFLKFLKWKKRSLGPFILSIYLPSAMFVTMSWVRYIISSNVSFLAERLFLSSEIFHALGGLLRAPRHRSSKNCSSCDSLSCPCQHV